ncbi:T9SS type A sorting domain-containing protein [Rhodohalobacter mucosus]|nr:T9SS type A sorting domain-containing protein [Rhodohalobacter mucosus]
MAEFQPDDNRFTSGNGTFEPGAIPYLENPGTSVDALPHNRAYFESHLEFVSNYYRRMSDSRLSISYTVLPDVYRLPEPMENYTDTGTDPELTPLARLVTDAWSLVAGSGDLPLEEFSQGDIRTAFVIFHAGIGRDIKLTGTTLDRTPQDIPSVYLDRDALSSLLADPSFTGIPIDNGSVIVNNSLIIPRTQTRAGTDVTGNRFLVPLSINGMLAAQLGSHLGLPDLFNTETGESGIGRFGLMDGASIFAYNGLFPPALSAWEKIRLGWAEPIELAYSESATLTLPADAPGLSQRIYKIPISSGEYFLIENRHRDPLGNGITLTIRKPDGSVATATFTNSDEAFVNQEPGFDALLEAGVIEDVSHFDFALPGGLDRSNPESPEPVELNGGILIWHIDEAVIREKEPENAINNDPDRRGVKLMEADGAQDIGRRVAIGLSENPVNGSPYDFWWSGNNATVVSAGGQFTLYQNRFGPDTTPDNSSHAGTPSPFELLNFSDNIPEAAFEIAPADPFPNLYQLIDSRENFPLTVRMNRSDAYYSAYPLSMIPFDTGGRERFVMPGTNGFLIYDPVTSGFTADPVSYTSGLQPLLYDSGNRLATAGLPSGTQEPGTLLLFDLTTPEITTETVLDLPESPAWISESEGRQIDLGGTVFRYNYAGDQLLEDENGFIRRSAESTGYQALISGSSLVLRYPGGSESFNLNQSEPNERLHPGVIRTDDNRVYFYLLTGNRLSVYSPDDNYRTERILYTGDAFSRPAIADIDKDGLPDFVLTDQENNLMTAINLNGTTMNGFPVYPPEGYRLHGTPLAADVNADGVQNLIASADNGFSSVLFAYTSDGAPTEGFPLTVGPVAVPGSAPVYPAISGPYLAAFGDGGDLKVWLFENMRDVLWPSAYGTENNNKISGFTGASDVQAPQFGLLNRNETYNWPNPARDETMLRYQTSNPAEIVITITSISGRKVYSETIRSRGGLPEEHRIDTSGWASGAYFARITAESSQQKESKTVSIAIVK